MHSVSDGVSDDRLSVIKSRISQINLRRALEYYGMQFDSKGFARCPFHAEDTGSFAVKGSWGHCFGCGVNVNLISFVMRQYGLKYSEAVKMIGDDFGIDTQSRATPNEIAQRRLAARRNEEYQAAVQQAEQTYLDALADWLDEYQFYDIARRIDPLSAACAKRLIRQQFSAHTLEKAEEQYYNLRSKRRAETK